MFKKRAKELCLGALNASFVLLSQYLFASIGIAEAFEGQNLWQNVKSQ